MELVSHYGLKTGTLRKNQFGDYVLWFPRAIKAHTPKFPRWWFGPYKIQYCLPNNTVLLVTIDKFDPNPVLVNINKLKSYKFIEDQTFQPILVKPNDFLLEEPLEVKYYDNLSN
jgi:hypothetical protein